LRTIHLRLKDALMAKKPHQAKPDDPEQSQRFKDAAKELEADDPKALDRAFKKVATSKPDKDKSG
jgi:hypothetical protein